MAQISVSNLSFSYDGSVDTVFENTSFCIDTNWKLGFVGRNGKGKTTFLNLLLGRYSFYGEIKTPVTFDYFPYSLSTISNAPFVLSDTRFAKVVPVTVSMSFPVNFRASIIPEKVKVMFFATV